MGADLYIRNMDREAQYTGFEVSDRARANGYFRDCYNGRGLFAVMNSTLGLKGRENGELSWWWTADRKDLMKDDPVEGKVMTLKGVRKFKKELAPIVKKFVTAEKMTYSEFTGKKDKDGNYIYVSKKIHATHMADYREWAKGLIIYLNLAIRKNSGIIFSV